jgi:bifunctional non-homologous end joining protein LigD
VIAKRLDSRYEAGRRSGAWQKMRVNLEQEFVVGGFTPGTYGFDSLVIGFYRDAPPLTSAQRAALPKSRRQYVVQPRELVYCRSSRERNPPGTLTIQFP